MLQRLDIDLSALDFSQDQPDPSVTAVIPARNEESTVGDVVRECKKYAGHVIVVEGGSNDDTAKVMSEAGAEVIGTRASERRCAAGRGKHVTTPISVFVDADGSTTPLIFRF